MIQTIILMFYNEFKTYIRFFILTGSNTGALDPPEVLLGCHKTSLNTTKRNFARGSFDELAIFNRWLNNTELPYFLGGYS